MEDIFLFLASFARILLELVSLSMMVRALLPIFFDPEDNKIYAITVMMTEPIAAPVRAVLFRFNIGQGTPIDWGFFSAYILINILQVVLPAF